MSRCVIVGGAKIHNYPKIREYLRKDDFFIYCDCGLSHREMLGAAPDLIVGDFDSHDNPHWPVETIVLPCEKDDTDTVYAVREALKRGFGEFLLIGVIGQRLDHTLGNVSILLKLDSLCLPAKIVDDYSEMEIVSRDTAYIKDEFSFFSLLNISGQASGVTIRNAKYPMEQGEVSCEYQFAVSNEVLPGKTASVSVENGRLLLIRDF